MVYGKDGVFNAEKLIDLLGAFEEFKVRITSHESPSVLHKFYSSVYMCGEEHNAVVWEV